MMPVMKTPLLLSSVLLVAAAGCNSGPTKSESLQVFAAATAAMAQAQSRAVADAQAVAPADLALDFSGPCTLGGTVGVSGRYDTSGSGQNAAFDLTVAFDNCREVTGTLDGNLRWTSVVDGSSFTATMKGDLGFEGNNVSASCDFDLRLAVDSTSVSYSGSLCGYDVQADLNVGRP